MKIRLDIKQGEFCMLTKSANFGYSLCHQYPTINPRTKEASVGSKVTFHADLQQVASKIVWLGLEGDSLDEVVDSMIALSQRLTEALEKQQ